ncbi:MAG: fumarate/nitrate reduction transcriptional regulator Fnr [Gammaproteobacteria bacterium]
MSPTHQIFDISKFKVSCGDCSLAELCLPWGLGMDDLDQLEKIVKSTKPLQRGDYLYRSGDRFQHIYAVRSGAIKSYRATEDGNEQILGFYLPGELLGLDAVEQKKHKCTTVALETSSCCAIPFARLEELSQQLPGLQHQMYRLMSRELSTENESLLLLGKKGAEEKIATFLLNLSARLHLLGYSATEFRLPMSRQEIGNYLGLTVETVSRTFSRLQRDKLIAIERKLITIAERDVLHSMCAGYKERAEDGHSAA